MSFCRISSLTGNLLLAAFVWLYLIFILCLIPSFFFFPVAVLLKDDYFVRGAGLPGRFKAEKMEFHWGQSNGSAGSEHSINGRRFPVEVKHPVPSVHFDKWATRGLEGQRWMLEPGKLRLCLDIWGFYRDQKPLPKLFVNAVNSKRKRQHKLLLVDQT